MNVNPVSTAKLGTHPLHPMLIPFPVAFLVGAFVTDLAFIGTGDGFWARASIWLIGAGVVMALLAAVAGFTDFFGEARIRALNDAWYHMFGNLAAVIIAFFNFLIRYNQGAEAAIRPWGWILSLVVVGILLFTGWKGWALVHSHHVAVQDAPGQTSSEPVMTHRDPGRHAA
ncbi:putative membrane protein [Nitrobacteraceae bacterium AZCC 1564]